MEEGLGPRHRHIRREDRKNEERTLIEGILDYLDRRKGIYLRISKNRAYFIAIMLKHPKESYIHKDEDASSRPDQKRGVRLHETKYYFSMNDSAGVLNPGGVVTFTKVHNQITGNDVGTLEGRNPKDFDGRKIQIESYTTSAHTHLGRSPEYYPNKYKIILEE